MSERAAPEWFTTALSEPSTDGTTDVAGRPITWTSWGDPGRPAVVLVHGGAAHRHWWDFLAPLLLPHHHVIAVDLSGHGDAGRRDRYSVEQWADEVVAVAHDAGTVAPPVVVGHSLGGYVTIVAAARHGDALAGAVVVDSPVRRPDPESEEGRGGRAFKQPGVYPTLDAAMARFSLVPRQPLAHDFIRDHVARRSLVETPDGWTWKFDPGIFTERTERRPLHGDLAMVRCRLAFFHGQHSAIVDDDVTAYMDEVLGRTAPFVEIPDAHHHLILDQPLAFTAALRAILADWAHTIPRRSPPGVPTTS